MQFNQSATLPRLTTRYKRLATIATIVVLLVAVVSSAYVYQIKTNSADSLQQFSTIKQLASQIKHQVVETQTRLNNLLLSSSLEQSDAPVKTLDGAIRYSRDLVRMSATIGNGFAKDLAVLAAQLQNYRQLLVDLLERRQDLNWLYPALPFINGSMLDANQQYETANLLAINELKEEGDKPYINEDFQYFYETNDLWRRIILNFRAMLIRFSGLQNVPLGASAEENNILLLFEELQARLHSIAALGASGKLSFQHPWG